MINVGICPEAQQRFLYFPGSSARFFFSQSMISRNPGNSDTKSGNSATELHRLTKKMNQYSLEFHWNFTGLN